VTGQSEGETLRRAGYGPTASLVVGQRGARTRQRIVEETLRLFESHGFHGTSVDAIAKAAGISRSTLYQYFESKEQIFVELLNECGSALMRVARRIGPLGPTQLGFDNLHWWLGEWAYVYDKYATMFVQWARVDTPGTGPTVRPLVTGFSRSYRERIALRLESSDVVGLDPLDAALAVTAVVHRFNYFRHMRVVPPWLNSDQLLDGLAVFVQLLLFPNTPLEVFDVVERPPRRPQPDVRTPARYETADKIPDRLADLRPRAAATVRQLIDTAARLFTYHGYHGIGVAEVVAEAGFARGTFYKYFDEKLDLLLQLTRECAGDMHALVTRFTEIDPGDEDAADDLRAWLGDYLPFHARYLGVMRAWLEGTSRDPRLLAVVEQATGHMRQAALEVLARVDRPHPLDPDLAVTIQGALLERMPEAALQQDPHRPPGEIIELIAAVMMRCLYNSGGS